jgi:hypothetical protein
MPKYTLTQKIISMLTLGAGATLVPMSALAQGSGFDPALQEWVASGIVLAIGIMNMLTWVFFLFLTVVLDPAFIFDSGSGFLTILNNIWQLARDLVNIFFAIALIGAAVYTVITANKDFVMSHLKKFILAVILVNFSWFIPRLIIDVSNVAAAAIYGIPSLLVTSSSSAACTVLSPVPIPGVTCNAAGDKFRCQCAMVTDAKFFPGIADQLIMAGSYYCPLPDLICLKFEDLDVNTTAGHSTILNGLIVNHARLIGLATVPPSSGETSLSATIQFLITEIIVLVIHIALFFPLAAMLVAFIIRIPVLWMTMAFMPFVALEGMIPGDFGEYPAKIKKAFLQAAMLPAIVAIPLTIGFIMVNAGAGILSTTSGLAVFDGVGMRLTDSISTFAELLWLGMTLAVLWVGVFSALSKIDFSKHITEGIKGFGQKIGGIALQLPLRIPIPTPSGGFTTPFSMNRRYGIDALSNAFRTSENPLSDLYSGRAAHQAELTRSAERFRNTANSPELGRLTDKIGTLAENIENGRLNSRGEGVVREIERDLNITINREDPLSDLRNYKSLLRQNNVGNEVITNMETSLNNLERAIRPPSAAPAAPATPAAPVPPTAPPATPGE